MTCPAKFDPFGERDAALIEHAQACPECGDVLGVLGAAGVIWKEEAASDEARAVFRERRLSWTRAWRPARTAVLSAVFFVAIGAASAWALGQFARNWAESSVLPAPVVSPVTSPRPAPSAPPPPPADREAEPTAAPTPSASASPAPMTSATPTRTTRVAAPTTAAELWEHGLARLDEGDREGAARLFRTVIDAPNVDAELRRRAMFRWAQVLLAMGDTVTPTDTLWQLVQGTDSAIGLDAGLLLERCAPGDRRRVWETYLASNPDEQFRAQAIARRNAAPLSRAAEAAPATRHGDETTR
jgi:hypothetical protein